MEFCSRLCSFSNLSFVCRHRTAKARNVCHSTKYMMLHVRDCCGLLSNGDVCPFPWCRKTKHLLYHLVTCKKKEDGSKCSICCPENLSSNLTELVGLNSYRRKIFVERTKAVAAAAAAKRQQMMQIPPAPPTNPAQESELKPNATAAQATMPIGNASQGSPQQAATSAANEETAL